MCGANVRHLTPSEASAGPAAPSRARFWSCSMQNRARDGAAWPAEASLGPGGRTLAPHTKKPGIWWNLGELLCGHYFGTFGGPRFGAILGRGPGSTPTPWPPWLRQRPQNVVFGSDVSKSTDPPPLRVPGSSSGRPGPRFPCSYRCSYMGGIFKYASAHIYNRF